MCSLMACGLRNGGGSPELTDTAHDSSWAGLRTGRAAVSLVFLLASLAGVVLLAKMLAPALDAAVDALLGEVAAFYDAQDATPPAVALHAIGE